MVQLVSFESGKLGAAIVVLATTVAVGLPLTYASHTEPSSPATSPATQTPGRPASDKPAAEADGFLPTPAGDPADDFAPRRDQFESPEPAPPDLLGAAEPLDLEPDVEGPLGEAAMMADPQRPGDAAADANQEVDPFADLFLDPPAGDLSSSTSETPPPPADMERMTYVEPTTAAVEQVPPPPQTSLLFPALPSEHGYAVLVAAPVHEALISRCEIPLQAVSSGSVGSPPPPELNEQPPVTSSEVPLFVGNNVQWIGGYWAWLADAEKYVWISGVYRDVPPGRIWQPGQWTRTADGYRWDSGYWAEADQTINRTVSQRRQREAAPPLAQDLPPQQLPPNRDSFWIPGVWLAEEATSDQLTSVQSATGDRTDGYRWQKGFWAPRSAQWIWQPAHYVRAGDDFVFVSGYWDYEPHFRGQAYAAVDFGNSPGTAAASYRPLYPLCRPVSVMLHLFFKPNSRTVFYGDLYDAGYSALGYQAWYLPAESTRSSLESDSPLLDFYTWKYQALGIDFVSSMARFERHFRSAPSIRPAAQLAATPRLAYREGLAGAVYANSFDAIVRGVVAGQSAVKLADGQPVRVADRSAAKPAVVVDAATGLDNANPASTTVITAAAGQPLQSMMPPPDAAPFGLPGTSQLMVLPGGRIIAAPPVMPLAPVVTAPQVTASAAEADAIPPEADLNLLFGRP